MKLTLARAAAATAVAATAAVAVPALTTAQAPPGRTFTVQEKVQSVVADDLAPRSPRPVMSPRGRVSDGDRLVTRQAVFDQARKPIGSLLTDCSGAGPTKPLFGGAKLLCTITYDLVDGQIVAAGVVRLDRFEIAIVGGTGAYAGARGTVSTVKPADGFDSADTITLTAP